MCEHVRLIESYETAKVCASLISENIGLCTSGVIEFNEWRPQDGCKCCHEDPTTWSAIPGSDAFLVRSINDKNVARICDFLSILLVCNLNISHTAIFKFVFL